MDQSPPILETKPDSPESAPRMSLAARLMNVFAIPGDVFEEVKRSAHAAGNWLVPMLLTALIVAISGAVVAAQPAIRQKLREQQEQQIERQVKAGKMTQQQADQYLAMQEKVLSPLMLRIFAAFGGIVLAVFKIFGWALVLWLGGRWFFKARFSYLKAAEIAGLASMIGVLGTVVTLLLQVNLSDPSASPSLAIAVGEMDPKKPLHLILAALNLFHLWQLVLLASGLRRLANVSFSSAGFLVIGFWLGWTLLWIVIGSVTAALVG